MKLLIRLLFTLVGIGLLGALVWTMFSVPISGYLFRQGLERQLQAGNARPMQGLHVYLCGTGSPLPDPTRSGPCLGILAGDRVFVVDPGEGAARRLATMGFPTPSVEAIILTHLHSDHIDGLGGVLLQAWVGGARKEPLPVFGPEGVTRVVAGVNEMFAPDSIFRTAHHGTEVADPAGYGASPKLISPDDSGRLDVIRDDSMHLTAVLVSHSPVKPAIGLRFDHAGRSVSFSGDTLYDARFVALSEGVDLMLHDAMQHKMVEQFEEAARSRESPGPLPKILHDIVDYHASPTDAARAAQDANAGLLVLTHIAPPLPSKVLYPAFLDDAPDHFDGDIVIGEDGMIFSFEPLN